MDASDSDDTASDDFQVRAGRGKGPFRNIGFVMVGLGALLAFVGGVGGMHQLFTKETKGSSTDEKMSAPEGVTTRGAEPSADLNDAEDLLEGGGGPGGDSLGPSPQLDMSSLVCSGAGICGRYVRGRACQCNDACAGHHNCCDDFMSVCTGYQPSDPRLLKRSSAPLLEFYMYRTQNDQDYPPLNTNLASLGGVLWYLQNEIVNRCDSGRGNGQFGYRRFKKTRILRYKVQTKAPEPLFGKGMNFGTRVAFDYAQNTGSWYPDKDKRRQYDVYGFNVGCNTLGLGPYPKCPSAEGDREGFCPLKYPAAYWYSMPGSCPSERLGRKSTKCVEQEPGGYCKGEPTGQGNCTWTYEDAGEIDIDELVGIKPPAFRDHMDFCRKGCLEYVKYGWGKDKGKCGITWWDSRFDESKNQWRMDQVDEAFFKKYPTLPRESSLAPPNCDFNKDAFYRGL